MTVKIPEELIDDLNEGQVVLFVGHDLDTAHYHLPSMANLASELVNETGEVCRICRDGQTCRHPDVCHYTFQEVARSYEQQRDRNRLIRWLVDKLGTKEQPSPAFQAIAQLPFEAIVTSSYDGRLEEAYRGAGWPYDLIADDSLAAASDPGRVKIIHINGRASYPGSLVLTDVEQASLFSDRPQMADSIRYYLNYRTCLFVDFGFNDDYFKGLYWTAVAKTADKRRLIYIVDPTAKASESGITKLSYDPAEFLVALTEVAGRPAEPVTMPEPDPPQAPYKFLDYFEERDRAIFFGRSEETEQLAFRIKANPVTVLYGYSGMGKTSLLRAGVLPQLKHLEAYGTITTRLGDDPLQSIQAAIKDAAGAGDARRLLILDQAEELFTAVKDKTTRLACVQSLLAAVQDDPLNFHLLISLRIEFLGQLEDLFDQLEAEALLDNRYRLGPLGRAQTERAIRAPAALFEVIYEEILVDELLDYLALEGFDPSYLQIICYQLYRDLLEGPSTDTPVEQTREDEPSGTQTITMARYEAMGKAEGILATFLDKQLAKIEKEIIIEDYRTKVEIILKNLVTIDQTKIALQPEEIQRRVAYAALDRADVEIILRSLQDRRIIRGLEDGRYELAHDVLVPKIWTWMDQADRARLNAANTLQRAIKRYQEAQSYLLTADEQAAIAQAVGALAFNWQELGLLLMSATTDLGRQHVRRWVERIRASQEGVEAVLTFLQTAQGSMEETVRDSALRAEIAVDLRLRRVLREVITKFFNLSELAEVCLYLGIDFEQLPGRGKMEKALDLLIEMDKSGKLDILAATLRWFRPSAEGLEKYVIAPPPPSENVALYESIQELFSYHELDELVFFLELETANLVREGIPMSEYARNLVMSFHRQDRLDHLWLAVGRFRPNAITNLNERLENTLIKRLDLEQLHTLWFDLNVDYQALNETSKRNLVAALVRYMERYNRTTELIDAILLPDRAGSGRFEVALLRVMESSLSMNELRDLCFSLNVDAEDIVGNTVSAKSRELISMKQRQGRLSELVLALWEERPHLKIWQQISEFSTGQRDKLTLIRDFLGEPSAELEREEVGDWLDRLEPISLRTTLHQILARIITNSREFHDVCFDLQVYSENLGGETLGEKQIALLNYLWRREGLVELKEYLIERYPAAVLGQKNKEIPQKPTLIKEASLPQTLPNILREYYKDRASLITLCFYLGIEYDDLYGETMDDKHLDLINILNRRDRLADLGRQVISDFPMLANVIGDKVDEPK